MILYCYELFKIFEYLYIILVAAFSGNYTEILIKSLKNLTHINNSSFD